MTSAGKDETWPSGSKDTRKLSVLLLVVTIALFLDNMLVTTVVPILPKYLRDLQHQRMKQTANESVAVNLTISNSTLPKTSLDGVQNVDNFTNALNHTPHQHGSPHTHEVHNDQNSAGRRHAEILAEAREFGFILGAKPLVQLLANPFVGFLSHKFGCRNAMLFGFVIMFSSTLLLAFGEVYEVLLIARGLQGIGSSCTSVTGLAVLPECFKDTKKRERAMRIALGGLAFGMSVGAPFGGVSYYLLGKMAPFLILCGLTFIDAFLLLFVLPSGVTSRKKDVKSSSMITLGSDPYILITAGGLFLICAAYALIETGLPLWLIDTRNLPEWQLGLCLAPNPLFFIFTINVLGIWLYRLPKWLLLCLGSFFTGLSLVMFPVYPSLYYLIAPNIAMGFGAGLIDLAVMPELAYLVDIRHKPAYSNVYAIADVAVCLGLTIGPSGGAFLFEKIGFLWMMIAAGTVCFIYTPFSYFLKNPPITNRTKASQESQTTHRLITNGQANAN